MTKIDHAEMVNMKLHSKIHVAGAYEVVRVPGGWIYTLDQTLYGATDTEGYSISSTFVPIPNENTT